MASSVWAPSCRHPQSLCCGSRSKRRGRRRQQQQQQQQLLLLLRLLGRYSTLREHDDEVNHKGTATTPTTTTTAQERPSVGNRRCVEHRLLKGAHKARFGKGFHAILAEEANIIVRPSAVAHLMMGKTGTIGYTLRYRTKRIVCNMWADRQPLAPHRFPK